MDVLLNTIGLTTQELTQLVVVAVLLIVGLGALRMFAKMAKSMVRMGCAVIILIVVGLFVLNVLN